METTIDDSKVIDVIEVEEPAEASGMIEAGTPADLLRIAVVGGADVEKLERLMALQERWEKEQARKAFFAAMNRVQSQVEPIIKRSVNQQTRSKYAKLEAVNRVLKPLMTQEGFSVAFSEGEGKDGQVRVNAMVMHKDGHSQEYHVDLALDNKGMQGAVNKTEVHGKASTLSYGRRYLATLIFDLAFLDEDDDGNQGKHAAIISEKQAATLADLCNASGSSIEGVCRSAGVESLAEYPLAAFGYVCGQLKKRADAKQKEGV
jgi:hypothetical protein